MWRATVIWRDGSRQVESFVVREAARDCARLASQQPGVFAVEVVFVESNQ